MTTDSTSERGAASVAPLTFFVQKTLFGIAPDSNFNCRVQVKDTESENKSQHREGATDQLLEFGLQVLEVVDEFLFGHLLIICLEFIKYLYLCERKSSFLRCRIVVPAKGMGSFPIQLQSILFLSLKSHRVSFVHPSTLLLSTRTYPPEAVVCRSKKLNLKANHNIFFIYRATS